MSKRHRPRVVADSGAPPIFPPPPAGLGTADRQEWRRLVRDMSAGGPLFADDAEWIGKLVHMEGVIRKSRKVVDRHRRDPKFRVTVAESRVALAAMEATLTGLHEIRRKFIAQRTSVAALSADTAAPAAGV